LPEESHPSRGLALGEGTGCPLSCWGQPALGSPSSISPSFSLSPPQPLCPVTRITHHRKHRMIAKMLGRLAMRTHATVAAAQPKLKKESTFVRTWLRVPAAWPVIAITAGAVVFSSYKIYHDLSGPDYHFNRYERSTLDYVENSRDPSTAIAHGQSAFHRGPSFIRERLIKME